MKKKKRKKLYKLYSGSQYYSLKSKPVWITPSLPPVVVPHSKDLNHTDENVDKIQLEANALVDNIALHHTPLCHAGVGQDLLDVVQGETTEDSETTVQPDFVRPGKGASGSGGEGEWSKTGKSDDSDTSEQRSTEVQVLLLLSGGADKCERTHHSDGVETSTSEKGGVHEHQGREESGLGDVETGPETILHHIAR